ncbi:glucocorticoid-induced transcript 1 protein-like isoform X1 [Mytilus californianus]|uniref:glucocorticoid-induced transcript 1 protein-like isoform X1 n=1 Tax=Mytilus californianus TaxID=6549 RepID=UPI002247A7DA|nr:glucocorticoid-induced transcript 1 protein-like isoform X1 [Mytilus californianus]
MSSQGSQRGRVNLSPSAMPSMMRPMKAVKPFTLKGSPTRKSPVCSPTPIAIGHRNSPERKSPISPSFKVEKPRAVRSNGSPSLRRAGSLEAIYNSYLSGKWPTPEVLSSHFMVDQTTQTPDDWEINNQQKTKKKKKSHGRSASFGQGDHVANAKNIHYIKHRLQKTKEGSRQNGKQSPVPGNHQALSSTAPAALQGLQRASKPQGIPNHIPKSSNLSRYQRNSVEGLNTEIEKLVLHNREEELDRVCSPDTLISILSQFAYDIPDGHKAPCPELVNRGSSTRSIDTQTPGTGNLSDNSSGSRSHSVSPAIPIIPGHMDSSRPSSESSPRRPSSDSSPRRPSSEYSPREMEKVEGCESPDSLQKKISSPGPNNSYLFVREPPDGCEKVKVIDEDTKSHPIIKEPLLYCPIKPSQFILKPSVDSAFCPLRKMYTPEVTIKSQGTQSTQTSTSVSQ